MPLTQHLLLCAISVVSTVDCRPLRDVAQPGQMETSFTVAHVNFDRAFMRQILMADNTCGKTTNDFS
jgi:hypothetical protein